MKIYISADIEGINGINEWNDTYETNGDYAIYKKQMNDEVLAVVKACNSLGLKIFL